MRNLQNFAGPSFIMRQKLVLFRGELEPIPDLGVAFVFHSKNYIWSCIFKSLFKMEKRKYADRLPQTVKSILANSFLTI